MGGAIVLFGGAGEPTVQLSVIALYNLGAFHCGEQQSVVIQC